MSSAVSSNGDGTRSNGRGIRPHHTAAGRMILIRLYESNGSGASFSAGSDCGTSGPTSSSQQGRPRRFSTCRFSKSASKRDGCLVWRAVEAGRRNRLVAYRDGG